jgi:hypothetical protein
MNHCGDGFGSPTENEYGHELSLKQGLLSLRIKRVSGH